MNRLFIRLYLDEDVNVLIAELLRSGNFEAITTHDVKRTEQTDEQQLQYATGRGLAPLTHNRRDFEELARNYAAADQMHHGIIVAVRRSPQRIAARLLGILNHVTADEFENQFRYI